MLPSSPNFNSLFVSVCFLTCSESKVPGLILCHWNVGYVLYQPSPSWLVFRLHSTSLLYHEPFWMYSCNVDCFVNEYTPGRILMFGFARCLVGRVLQGGKSRRFRRVLVVMIRSCRQHSRSWTCSLSKPLRKWICLKRMAMLSILPTQRVNINHTLFFLSFISKEKKRKEKKRKGLACIWGPEWLCWPGLHIL